MSAVARPGTGRPGSRNTPHDSRARTRRVPGQHRHHPKGYGYSSIGFNAFWLRGTPNTLGILQDLGFIYYIDDIKGTREIRVILYAKDDSFVSARHWEQTHCSGLRVSRPQPFGNRPGQNAPTHNRGTLLTPVGLVSPDRRRFRHPNSSPATIASRRAGNFGGSSRFLGWLPCRAESRIVSDTLNAEGGRCADNAEQQSDRQSAYRTQDGAKLTFTT